MPDGTRKDFLGVATIVSWVENGQFDVPEWQREFVRKPEWVAALMDSLLRTPEIPIGSLLVWEPGAEEMPRGGRYRPDSNASFLVLDGQGRLTGLLAALGIRPPWIPEEKWAKLGGPALAVGVSFDNDRTPVFRPLSSSIQDQIPLAAVFRRENLDEMLAATGMAIGGDLMAAVADLRARLPLTRIRIDWMPGVFADAVVAFERRQAAGAISKVKSDEFYLCMLSAICGPLARDLVDPLLDEAKQRGFGRSVSRKVVKDMVERLLPNKGRDARQPTPDEVRRVGERVTMACRRTMDYLAAYGVTRDELLPVASVVPVLAHVFDGFRHAVDDDFARRWTVHVIARNVQLSRHRSLFRKIMNVGTYGQAQAILASLVSGSMNPFAPERLDYTLTKAKHYDAGGALFAMASMAAVEGAVRDLKHQDTTVWPDKRMRLRPLCLKPQPWLLTHHAFMTEDAEEVIRVSGGWTVKAYEALRCGDTILRAHQLPKPDPTVDPDDLPDWLHSQRAPLIAAVIDEFQKDIGALADSPNAGPDTLPFGDPS